MASSAFSPEHHSADQPTATNRQFWERRTEECTGRVVVDALAVHLHCGGAGVQLVEGVHSLARRDDPLAVGELVQRQLRRDLVQLLAAHVGHERDRLQALHHLAPSLAPLLHGVRERLVLLLRRPPRGPLHRAASRRQRDRAQDLRARGEQAALPGKLRGEELLRRLRVLSRAPGARTRELLELGPESSWSSDRQLPTAEQLRQFPAGRGQTLRPTCVDAIG